MLLVVPRKADDYVNTDNDIKQIEFKEKSDDDDDSDSGSDTDSDKSSEGWRTPKDKKIRIHKM